MAHTKVYGFCDAKCKVEVAPKSVVDSVVNISDTALKVANQTQTSVSEKLDKDGTAQRSIGDANGRNIISTYATKSELDAKLRKIEFSTWNDFINLLKNGKQGDLFGLTMDFDAIAFGGGGTSLGGNGKVHAFGFFTFDEITVTDGTITKLECFGSGEIDGKDNFSIEGYEGLEYFQCTGFGTDVYLGVNGTAFRGFVGGQFSYFILPVGAFAEQGTISDCHGWYISI